MKFSLIGLIVLFAASVFSQTITSDGKGLPPNTGNSTYQQILPGSVKDSPSFVVGANSLSTEGYILKPHTFTRKQLLLIWRSLYSQVNALEKPYYDKMDPVGMGNDNRIQELKDLMWLVEVELRLNQ